MNRPFFLSALLAATAALAGCADYGHSYRDGYYQPAEGRYGDYYYNEPRRYRYPYGYPYYGYPYYGGYFYHPYYYGGFYPYGHHPLSYSFDYFGGYGGGDYGYGFGLGYGYSSHHHRFRDRHGDADDHHEFDRHHRGDPGDEDRSHRRRFEPSADRRDRYIRRTPPDKVAPGTGYLMKVDGPRREAGPESVMVQPQPAIRSGPLPGSGHEPLRRVSPHHPLPRRSERERLVLQPRQEPIPAPLRSAAPARPAHGVAAQASPYSQPVRQPRPAGFGKSDRGPPVPHSVDRPAPASRTMVNRSPARAVRSSDKDHEEE